MANSTNQKKVSLQDQGIQGVKKVNWNLSVPVLAEASIKREESVLSAHGALIVRTDKYTGRSPNDKFTVKEPSSDEKIWWGNVNRPFDPKKFDQLHKRVLEHLKGKELFVQDCYAGADPKHQVPIRVINEFAWHNIFARNMFVRINDNDALLNHVPEYTVISVPNFKADPKRDGTNSEAFIIPHFEKKIILVGGTHYAGEVKKSIFTLLNYLLPLKGVLSMHCSANVGKDGDSALLFGLSGTGKTTLSADPHRCLIGDDEHGWSDDGIFNFEGGCYAKMIKLSPTAEPEIYATTRQFGTILENVIYDEATREIDLDDGSITENTRGSYPLESIPNVVTEGKAGHPKNIIMLTCDAFGVLPPVARMSSTQAMYHFLSGYTAKVAGTERGIKEPQATFSACFGAPFMAHYPRVYARLLRDKIEKYGVHCWLINTGWSGGPYGVGHRVAIADSRAIVNAALSGELNQVKYRQDPIFGLDVPISCPNISSQDILDPRNTWKDKAAYEQKAHHLASLFHENFKAYAQYVGDEVQGAGPLV